MLVKGQVVFLYAFDVANEIVTARVREILSEKPVPFQIRLEHTFPKDVPLYRPLAITPSHPAARLQGQPVGLEVHIYDVGVVAVTMRVAVTPATLEDLMPFHDAKLDDGRRLDVAARELCTRVCGNLQDAMVASAPPPEPEAYTVFCLTEIDDARDANAWLARERRAVAGLLTQTPADRLSEAQVNEVLRIQRSYENSDLVVIDWDAALMVDLSGYMDDVLFVLELANLQLEEFKVMDQRLDRYLDRVYDELGRDRSVLSGLPRHVARALRRFRVDVARLADEVTHITKLFGDWYLARVYLGARDRFYLDQWRQSVEQRLAHIDQLHGVIYSEVYDQRMLWLEIAIVVLFVIDILGLFFFKR
jgi:hypothetical protein